MADPQQESKDAALASRESAEDRMAASNDAPAREAEAAAPHDSSTTRPRSAPPLPCPDAGALASMERQRVLRVLDAAANRASEGLRVAEDYVRFVLDDPFLTEELKRLRHDLAEALSRVPMSARLSARETLGDVGTCIALPAERRRRSAAHVLTANLTRSQEALRSLEEFGKTVDGDMAARLERLRYRCYTLQRAAETTRASLERMEGARLYVLLDGRASTQEFETLARAIVVAGADAVQLRDKSLDDRRLLERARTLRKIAAPGKTLFLVNDRPDLAVLARADGVHLGQEELTVKDARAIVGPDALVGVSTHTIEQARQAVLDGANYLGVGPVFPSATKRFEQFPGLPLLRVVAGEIRLPAFAIGGIRLENLGEVLEAGFRRVAVSGAITSRDSPASAVRSLLGAMHYVH